MYTSVVKANNAVGQYSLYHPPRLLDLRFYLWTPVNVSDTSFNLSVRPKPECYDWHTSLPMVTPRSCSNLHNRLSSSTKKHLFKGSEGPFVWSDSQAPCYISLFAVEDDYEGMFSLNQISYCSNWILAECGSHGGLAAVNLENLGKWYVTIAGDEPVGPEPRPQAMALPFMVLPSVSVLAASSETSSATS